MPDKVRGDEELSKDFFGNKLYEGDIVACLRRGASSSYHVYGIVVKVCEKTCLVFTTGDSDDSYAKVSEEYSHVLTEFCNGDMAELLRNSRVSRKASRDIIKRMDVV